MKGVSLQNLDGISVRVEYEYTAGEREEGPESRAAGPGSHGSVVVTGVNVCNEHGYGVMVDACHFSADWLAEAQENILQEIQE